MQIVDVYDAKTHLSQMLTKVESGEEILIARNGRPVARLTSLAASRTNRRPGAWRGKVTIADDARLQPSSRRLIEDGTADSRCRQYDIVAVPA